MNIFVGNLPWAIQDSSLRRMFSEFGAVDRAKVVTDRETGRTRGFGFVEMPNADEAHKAITALNGSDCEGRTLKVNQAEERADKIRGICRHEDVG